MQSREASHRIFIKDAVNEGKSKVVQYALPMFIVEMNDTQSILSLIIINSLKNEESNSFGK